MTKRTMKPKYFTIPNLLTLGNLFCGCLAAYYALALGNLKMVFWLVVIAAVLDFLDGFAARMLKSFSPIGKELDSLADMVSFGLVPAAALFRLYILAGGPQPFGFIIFIITLFSALRLAKFNIDENQTEEFIGLNTPANTLLITSFAYIYSDGILPVGAGWLIAGAVVLAVMLILPVRMFSLKFKNFSFRDNALRYIFLALSLAALALFGVAAVPVVMTMYIIVSLVRNFLRSKS